jgi:Zn-dependent protease with chaperone function
MGSVTFFGFMKKVTDPLLLVLLGIVMLIACTPRIALWEDLPPPRMGIRVGAMPNDKEALRLITLAIPLVAHTALPVNSIGISSISHERAKEYKIGLAGSMRCGNGSPPAAGCIIVVSELTARLSNTALQGMLAHELAHLKLGHKTDRSYGFHYGGKQKELDTDQVAVEILNAAGLCGRATMGQTLKEASIMVRGAWTGGDDHPSYLERQAQLEQMPANC